MAVATRRLANGTMASYLRSVTRLARHERGSRDKISIGFWPIGGDTAGWIGDRSRYAADNEQQTQGVPHDDADARSRAAVLARVAEPPQDHRESGESKIRIGLPPPVGKSSKSTNSRSGLAGSSMPGRFSRMKAG